ncbi:MAG: hypothetical protein D6798_15860 [Deltaproteobacteria bacterium]|nr:MAG: hypothetical protein D6798_15860 [Deltaproteobacteria bacterium]
MRRTLLAAVGVHLLSLVISLGLHLGVVAPYLVYRELASDLDLPGEEGAESGPTGNGGVELLEPPAPVTITLYEGSKTGKPPPSSKPAAPSAPRPGGGPPSGQPEAPSGGAAGGSADSTGRSGALPRDGVPGRKPPGKRRPCEPVDEIVQIDDHTWRVERELLDYYAGHLRQLERQVGVGSHRGPDGKRDGARLYLPRCSLLKQAGFRNGDVVHRVNGRKVNTIPQGVATWLAVRNDRVLRVELTRRSGETRIHRYRLR